MIYIIFAPSLTGGLRAGLRIVFAEAKKKKPLDARLGNTNVLLSQGEILAWRSIPNGSGVREG